MQVLLNTLKNKKVIPNTQAANTPRHKNKTAFYDEFNKLLNKTACHYSATLLVTKAHIMLGVRFNLRKRIAQKNTTVKDLANACSISATIMERKIYGTNQIYVDELYYICNRLDVSVNTITESEFTKH
ncbi:hypothetical protein MAH1_33630 [Sessilibacter sp. MAH1]